MENTNEGPTKFCKFCGAKIPADAVLCPKCGRQVEEIKQASAPATPNIVINNANANTNTNVNAGVAGGCMKNKWVALTLCLFLGFLGAHKFYEGKIGTGILYLCTAGFFLIGPILDFFTLLNKPNLYLVV